jgi:lysophospholipase L1-like esterase
VVLDDGVVEWRGALGFDRSDAGVAPRRLPDWTRSRIPDLFVESMVRMSSGVRLAFATNSDTIELDAQLTAFRFEGQPPMVHGVDLVIDGAVVVHEQTDTAQRFVLDPIARGVTGFEPAGPWCLRWSGLGSSTKRIEIWLPTNATTEIRALKVDDGATVAASANAALRWVHYGSSISHCMEVVHPTETWPALVARSSGLELASVALAGQCHLDQFVARTIRDLAPDYVSVKVGINVINADSMRERVFTPLLHGFVDTIRERCPDTPFVLVSPIFCPVAEDHPGPTSPKPDGKVRVWDRPAVLAEGSLTLRRVREIVGAFVAQRRAEGDENLHYVDGLTLFDASDWEAGDLPDDLHPNPQGYARMAERFAPQFAAVR